MPNLKQEILIKMQHKVTELKQLDSKTGLDFITKIKRLSGKHILYNRPYKDLQFNPQWEAINHKDKFFILNNYKLRKQTKNRCNNVKAHIKVGPLSDYRFAAFHFIVNQKR